jgi:hypothetical protein
MTKEDFLKVDISNVSQVYSGKRDCCRCGCGGEYTATSFMEEPRSEVNNKLVEKRLKRAKRLVKEGADIFYGDTFMDIQTGKDRTLTFYFDELKKK